MGEILKEIVLLNLPEAILIMIAMYSFNGVYAINFADIVHIIIISIILYITPIVLPVGLGQIIMLLLIYLYIRFTRNKNYCNQKSFVPIIISFVSVVISETMYLVSILGYTIEDLNNYFLLDCFSKFKILYPSKIITMFLIYILCKIILIGVRYMKMWYGEITKK